MARIRSIKPEFWTSEQVAECSPTARLLFVGLWNFCDDQGVHPASTKQLKMEVFPGDSFTLQEIADWITELRCAGLVAQYQCSQGLYWWAVTGWHHQKIDKPTNKYPPPQADDDAPTVRRAVGERSGIARPGEERRGEESTGGERKGGEGCSERSKTNGSKPAPPPDPPDPPEDGFLIFPCCGRDSPTWTLTQAKVAEYRESFPGIDVEAECRKALQWCRDNKLKRKTARGMPAFLSRWLSKEQDRCSRGPPSQEQQRAFVDVSKFKPPEPGK